MPSVSRWLSALLFGSHPLRRTVRVIVAVLILFALLGMLSACTTTPYVPPGLDRPLPQVPDDLKRPLKPLRTLESAT